MNVLRTNEALALVRAHAMASNDFQHRFFYFARFIFSGGFFLFEQDETERSGDDETLRYQNQRNSNDLDTAHMSCSRKTIYGIEKGDMPHK